MNPSTPQQQPRFIDREMSVYLDLMRLLAAICVVIAHMSQDGLYTEWGILWTYGHEAVVYFFVLSGLVISTSAYKKAGHWQEYVAARCARIYSVVLPAIVLSFVVKGFSAYMANDWLIGEMWKDDLHWSNVLYSVLFLNESWGIDGHLPWNDPFWSLCYEVWFYALFGVWFFYRGRGKWLLISLLALMAGPAILILMPVWLAGVWLARNGHRFNLGPAAGMVLWLASLLAIKIFSDSDIDVTVRTWLYENVRGYYRLGNSMRFPTDYVLMLVVMTNIVAFRSVAHLFKQPIQRIGPMVVAAAGVTFSIYLYHRPLTMAIAHLWGNKDHSEILSMAYLALVIALCAALGYVTERRKDPLHRFVLRRLGAPSTR